jgi:predicted secreted hydrolase
MRATRATLAALALGAIGAAGPQAPPVTPARPTPPPPPTAAAAPAADGWRRAGPGHDWSFPRDHHAHPGYRTEWWYLTGHLRDRDAPADAEPCSFQFTLFRIGLDPGWRLGSAGVDSAASAWRAANLVMGHAAVTDPAAGRHVFSEALWRAAGGLGGFGAPGDTLLAWCLAPPGTAGTWSLALVDGAFMVRAHDARRGLSFDLSCASPREPVLQGDGGFSPKDATGTAGSLYYSLPRLSVTGMLRRGDRDVPVAGSAWLDREVFTSTLAEGQSGWDWVSLQLDDGRDVMLYRLRRPDGTVDFALGSVSRPGATPSPLPAGSWTLEPLATWTSAATGAAYPVDWRLRVPGQAIDLELRATLDDQENVSARTGVHYWEGAVRAVVPAGSPAAGRLLGRGFVELTGYGEGSRPPV